MILDLLVVDLVGPHLFRRRTILPNTDIDVDIELAAATLLVPIGFALPSLIDHATAQFATVALIARAPEITLLL